MPERMRDDMSKKCGTPDKMRDKLPDEMLHKMPLPIKCKIHVYIYIFQPKCKIHCQIELRIQCGNMSEHRSDRMPDNR